MAITGTTIFSGPAAAARRDGAALRDARRREMLKHDAERQALYRRQELAGAVQVREAEVAHMRRELAAIETEIEDAEETMRVTGRRPADLNGLRCAALDFPVMIEGAVARLDAARAALVAASPVPADEPEPAPKKAARR